MLGEYPLENLNCRNNQMSYYITTYPNGLPKDIPVFTILPDKTKTETIQQIIKCPKENGCFTQETRSKCQCSRSGGCKINCICLCGASHDSCFNIIHQPL